MLQETSLDKALKMVLTGKPVLAAVKKAGDTGSAKYTFRPLNEILEKYIFLIQVPAVEEPEFKEKIAEMVRSVPAINAVNKPGDGCTKPREVVHDEKRGYSGFLHIRCRCGAEKKLFRENRIEFL